MVIPTDITQDALILGLISVVGYLIRAVFKPSKTEAMLAARILVGVILVLLRLAVKWQKEHKEHLETMISDATLLRNKLKKNKIVLG